jgi:hypothetical protein
MAGGNRIVNKNKKVNGLLAVQGDTESARYIPESFYEGIVVDVILDHTHPFYSPDGYNVGTIRVRLFSVDNARNSKLLDWAYPVDATIQEMPLLGELVLVQKILGSYFYNRKVYVAHRIQENGMLNLEKSLDRRTFQLRRKVAASSEELELNSHKFGEYFKPDNRVRPLKHFEGDVLIQGRMGHSIRFGSSQMQPGNKGLAPNIILRTGQGKNIEKDECTTDEIFGLVLEDINKDASSIWMTSDQVVPFEPSTIDAGSFFRSLSNTVQKYDGSQIILNSDRLVLNSKKSHVMLMANDEVYINSFNNTSIDTDKSIILTANIDILLFASRNVDIFTDVDFTLTAGRDLAILGEKKTSIYGKKIFIGTSENDEEPMVGGTSLSKFLARLILAFMGNPPLPPQTAQAATVVPAPLPGVATFQHVMTAMGPGVLNPFTIAQLVALYTELILPNPGQTVPIPFSGAPFNSSDNFVRLSNDVLFPIEKNNFEAGKSMTTEANKWLLSDKSSYKVK